MMCYVSRNWLVQQIISMVHRYIYCQRNRWKRLWELQLSFSHNVTVQHQLNRKRKKPNTMRATTLKLLLLVSSVTSQEPICREGDNAVLCGDRCLLPTPNVTDLVQCINGECNVTGAYEFFGEEEILDIFCPQAWNACGETICGGPRLRRRLMHGADSCPDLQSCQNL